jgi:cyanate lyase
MRGLDAAALAKDLGVTEAKVTAALQKVHEALKPATPPKTGTSTTAPTPPTAADKTARDKAFVSALAKELGVDEAKVTAALAKERAAHEAQHKAELTTRLDAAVTAGKLTAADKASVLKAFDAGVLGGPGGPRA